MHTHLRRLAPLAIASIAIIAAIACGSGDEAPNGDGAQSTPATPVVALSTAIEIGDPALNPSDPFLRTGPDGRVYLSWTEEDGAGRNMLLSIAGAGANEFPAGVRINDTPGELSAHGAENLGKFAVAHDGRVYAAWMKPLAEKRTGEQRLAVSNDGTSFAPAITVNDDGKVVNHAFSSLEVARDGTLLIAWIDGRERTNPADDRQTIYLTRSTDGGATLEPNRRIATESCACCRLGLQPMADGKTVFLAYRHVERAVADAKAAESIRNFVIARSDDGGATFGEPALVHDDGWKIEACPHTGIDLALGEDGALHAAWFTGGRSPDDAGVRYAVSRDGGATFEEHQLVAAGSADAVSHAQVAVDDANVYVVYDKFVGDMTHVFLRVSSDGGRTFGEPQQISGSHGMAQFPVITLAGGRAHVAWAEMGGHDTEDMTSRVFVRSLCFGEDTCGS